MFHAVTARDSAQSHPKPVVDSVGFEDTSACPCRSNLECDNVLYHTLWSPKIPGSLRPPTSSSLRAGSFRPRLCLRCWDANGRVILIAGRLIRKSRHKGQRRLRLPGYSLPATMGCGKVWIGWNPGWMRGLTRWSHGWTLRLANCASGWRIL